MANFTFLGYCPFYKTGNVEVLRLPVYSASALSTGWMTGCTFDTTEPIENYGFFPQEVIDYLAGFNVSSAQNTTYDNSIWDKTNGYGFAICSYGGSTSNNRTVILNSGSYVEWWGMGDFAKAEKTIRMFILEYNGSYYPGLVFTTDWTRVFSSNRSPSGNYAKITSLTIVSSPVAEITPTTAETPTFTQNLPVFGKMTYEQGDVADTLTIAAEVSDGGTLTYQWYKDDAAIDGATESSYTPSVEVGSAVYYCVVTNTLGEANATAQSESVAIIGYVVFLAASEPVPVGVAPKIDPFSMTLGWLIGSRIAGQRGKGGVMPEEPEVPEVPEVPGVPVGEPVAYLYNSRRLPGLPEWTKDYEIVTIVDPNLGDTYIKAAKGYTIESSWNITYGTSHTTYGVDVVRSPLENWAWQEPVAKTDDWLWSNSPYLNDGSTYPFWSNTDLICKNDDGTEYVGLAGSEPVPVYE